jgi:hypothetical protein
MTKRVEDGRINTDLNSKNSLVQLILIQYTIIINENMTVDTNVCV